MSENNSEHVSPFTADIGKKGDPNTAPFVTTEKKVLDNSSNGVMPKRTAVENDGGNTEEIWKVGVKAVKNAVPKIDQIAEDL